MPLRLGIPLFQSEISGKHDWVAGQYFVKNCVNALLTLPQNEIPEIVFFVLETIDPLFLKEIDPRIQIINIPEAIFLNNNASALNAIIKKLHCDVFFPLIYYPNYSLHDIATIGWVPDFQHCYYTEFFSEAILHSKDLLIKSLGSFCDVFYCSSQTVKNDFQKFYPDISERCFVVPFRSSISEKSLLSTPSPTKKYIYLPNQFWVHKNHKAVFEAWKALKDNGLDYLLICTGSTTDPRAPQHFEKLQEFITHHQLNIQILGFIDRENQLQLYRNAAAVLQPSLFEGWNTSIEDARALGKKLILSDISTHKEQCGDLAYYFESNNPNDLAKIIAGTWDSLPQGYDADEEKNHFTSYQNEIKTFGKLLLKTFETAKKQQKKPSCTYKPTFSFIIFAPEDLDALKEIVMSILSQQYSDIEIIVINANNTQTTEAWDHCVTFTSSKLYLNLVKNEWLIYLNPYQKLAPDSLTSLITFIMENPKTDVILANENFSIPKNISYENLFDIDLIECNIALHRKTFFELFHFNKTHCRELFFPHHLIMHLAKNNFTIVKKSTIFLKNIENNTIEAYAELVQQQIIEFGKVSPYIIHNMSKNLYYCLHAKHRGNKHRKFYLLIYFIFLWISMNVRAPGYCIKGLLAYLATRTIKFFKSRYAF